MSSDLNFLIEMGYSKSKAERALAASGNAGIELAMEWLMSHENDPDVEMSEGAGVSSNQSASDTSQGGDLVAKSIKCDDCGKIFRSVEEAEFHASKMKHANFSESTEEKKPLTEAEKKEQVAKLQEKLRQKKLEREEKEKRENHEREMKRRQMSKEISTAKSKHDELEIQKIAEERRREKEEDRKARQKIKDELERDKLERQQKFANKAAAAPAAQPAAAVAAPTATKTYDKCTLQIRFTNGQAVKQEFGAKEPLSAVRLFVELNRPDGAGPFVLMTTFPKKVFEGADMGTPLCELGLVPSAVLVVTKSS